MSFSFVEASVVESKDSRGDAKPSVLPAAEPSSLPSSANVSAILASNDSNSAVDTTGDSAFHVVQYPQPTPSNTTKKSVQFSSTLTSSNVALQHKSSNQMNSSKQHQSFSIVDSEVASRSRSNVISLHQGVASADDVMTKLRRLHDEANFQSGIELGINFLASEEQSVGISIFVTMEILHLLGRCMVGSMQLELARETYQRLHKCINAAPFVPSCAALKHDMMGEGNTENAASSRPTWQRMRKHDQREELQWKARYHTNMAQLHEASGEREEACSHYVLTWRYEARLHGPESVPAISTYITVAEIKSHLWDDKAAWSMLEHATDVLRRHIIRADQQEAAGVEDPVVGLKCVTTWMYATRLQSDILWRQKKFSEASMLLQGAMSLVKRFHLKPERPVLSAKAERAAKMELGLLHLAISEVAMESASSGHFEALKNVSAMSTSTDASQGHTSSRQDQSSMSRSSGVSPRRQAELLQTSQREECLYELAEKMEMIDDSLASADECFEPHLPPNHRFRTRTALRSIKFKLWRSDTISRIRRMRPSKKKPTTTKPSRSGLIDDATTADDRAFAFSTEHLASFTPYDADDAIQDTCATLDTLQQGVVRGRLHPEVMTDVSEFLGELYTGKGDHYRASKAFNEALSSAKVHFAADHETPVIIQHKLAESLAATGRYDDAYHLLLELKEWHSMCPSNRMAPIPLVVILHSIGNVLRLQERFKEAEQHYLMALEDTLCDSDTRCRILGNLAAMRLTKGDVLGAIEANKRCLKIRQEQFGEHHLEVAVTLANLAALYAKTGQWNLVESKSNDALSILQKKQPQSGGKPTSSLHKQLSSLLAEAKLKRKTRY